MHLCVRVAESERSESIKLVSFSIFGVFVCGGLNVKMCNEREKVSDRDSPKVGEIES